MRRPAAFSLVLATLAVAVSGPAHAATPTPLKQAYIVYQTNGKIPACVLPAKSLKQALAAIPADSAQYSPDFRDAIEAAIEAAASGACDKKGSSTPKTTTSAAPAAPTTTQAPPTSSTPAPAQTTSTAATTEATTSTPAATSTPQPQPTATPNPSVADDAIPAAAVNPTSTGAEDTPAPLIAVAIVLGLLALLALAVGLARFVGFEPAWLVRWRHAGQEAGWRASAAWSEFTDWVRLGR